ncbi:hypothetical protein HDU92_006533 [Lobulomyces angularis]|nr:hypothetical protein HDU92_006533 [Lobulomyces angularis]
MDYHTFQPALNPNYQRPKPVKKFMKNNQNKQQQNFLSKKSITENTFQPKEKKFIKKKEKNLKKNVKNNNNLEMKDTDFYFNTLNYNVNSVYLNNKNQKVLQPQLDINQQIKNRNPVSTTPKKFFHEYAGAQFQNSPTPESLPIPIFNKTPIKEPKSLVDQSTDNFAKNEFDFLLQEQVVQNFDQGLISKSLESIEHSDIYFPQQQQIFSKNQNLICSNKSNGQHNPNNYNGLNQDTMFGMEQKKFDGDFVSESIKERHNLRKKSEDLLHLLNPAISSEVQHNLLTGNYTTAYSNVGCDDNFSNLEQIGRDLKSILKIA